MPKPQFSPMAALALVAAGMTVREASSALGCHRATTYRLLEMARAVEAYELRPRDLTPMGLGVFSVCPHGARPMTPGEPFVCVDCHQSGLDWKPGMKAKPLPPERKRYSKGKLKGGK